MSHRHRAELLERGRQPGRYTTHERSLLTKSAKIAPTVSAPRASAWAARRALSSSLNQGHGASSDSARTIQPLALGSSLPVIAAISSRTELAQCRVVSPAGFTGYDDSPASSTIAAPHPAPRELRPDGIHDHGRESGPDPYPPRIVEGRTGLEIVEVDREARRLPQTRASVGPRQRQTGRTRRPAGFRGSLRAPGTSWPPPPPRSSRPGT